jgi:hypothetical protein
VQALFKGLGGLFASDPAEKTRKTYADRVEKINALEPAMVLLNNEALRAKTNDFKRRLAAGETLEDILVEAFAVRSKQPPSPPLCQRLLMPARHATWPRSAVTTPPRPATSPAPNNPRPPQNNPRRACRWCARLPSVSWGYGHSTCSSLAA